jgi:dTDP-4-dehydrorhamnose 3,5-epimerase|tara:strand:+ start:3132 stop:3680 length:549 start_codon:yes stop_codon:yes gene_type:complete
MEIKKTNNFKEPRLFYPTVYEDDRGFFMESFNDKIQNEINIPFLQDNHSKSKKGVIRGLHYQWDNPMGKLLRVPKGAGIDVIVDIRKDSPTYGKWERFNLNEYNHAILWVPPGFAQGFLALEEDTHLQYKTTALHNGNAEGAIHPLKSGLNIDWALPEKEILLSEKDKTAQTFEDYKSNPKF